MQAILLSKKDIEGELTQSLLVPLLKHTLQKLPKKLTVKCVDKRDYRVSETIPFIDQTSCPRHAVPVQSGNGFVFGRTLVADVKRKSSGPLGFAHWISTKNATHPEAGTGIEATYV